MSLYRTPNGFVSHADAVPEVKKVPSRRQAECAYCHIVALLDFKQADDEEIGDQVSTLRDFIWSR